MRTQVFAVTLGLALASAAASHAQKVTPFKLGTFERGGRTFLGLVLDDTRVLDITQANAAFQKSHPKVAKLSMPSEMTALIERYDNGVGDRLRAIANGAGKGAPYEYPVGRLKILPPVRPQVILNAGAYTHTSVAIHDAIRGAKAEVIEVHLSNTHAREAFRHHSYISPVAKGVILGFGARSYELALQSLFPSR